MHVKLAVVVDAHVAVLADRRVYLDLVVFGGANDLCIALHDGVLDHFGKSSLDLAEYGRNGGGCGVSRPHGPIGFVVSSDVYSKSSAHVDLCCLLY
jgi:hypothetical protein